LLQYGEAPQEWPDRMSLRSRRPALAPQR
jgi:hypothetical protein